MGNIENFMEKINKMWQENLFNNLLVVGILLSLGVTIYCKVTKKSLTEVFQEVMGIFNPPEVIE